MSAKPIVVQKYGGSSLASVEMLRAVAARIKERLERDDVAVVAVVSAMGESTDGLIELGRELTTGGRQDAREYDALLATGELVSASGLALALNAGGTKAMSLSGSQAGIHTETRHISARIAAVDASRIKTELQTHAVIVVAGFQGIDDSGDTTTLGRGGSDTTAVAMAIALKAKSCEIYTDVDGIHTADPRLCGETRKLDAIRFEEMLELSAMGAKMNPRSIELGAAYGMPIYVASAFGQTKGTTICAEEDLKMEVRRTVTGIAVERDVVKIAVLGVKDKPGVAASIVKPLAAQDINVNVIVQNTSATTAETDFTFSISKDDAERAETVLRQNKEIGYRELHVDGGFAKVSIVGTGVINSPGYAATMFETLANESVNIDMIVTSEIRITCVIADEQVKCAVNALHKAFELHTPH